MVVPTYVLNAGPMMPGQTFAPRGHNSWPRELAVAPEVHVMVDHAGQFAPPARAPIALAPRCVGKPATAVRLAVRSLEFHPLAASDCRTEGRAELPPCFSALPHAAPPYLEPNGRGLPLLEKTSVPSSATASTCAPSSSPSTEASPASGDSATVLCACDDGALEDGTSSTSTNVVGVQSILPPSADANTLAHKIWPHRGRAYRPSDVQLLERFLVLSRVSDVNDDTVKLLLRALKMLWCLDYSNEEVCSILAHASSYFLSIFSICGGRMSCTEEGSVLVALMYLAHTWVQDETCRLGVWHNHLFSRYCSLDTLKKTVFKLFEMRQFTLRVEAHDLSSRHEALAQALA